MNYCDAIKYLDTFLNHEQVTRYPYESAYKLQRMKALCSSMKNPQTDLRCVHIAGTKGKGSTAAMTESVLRAAGYKTGLYTSPHLETVRERIQIDGKPISERDFSAFVHVVQRTLSKQKANPRHGAFTYFELLTLMAFLAFAENQVDIAILEVGLGGRLDATNVVEPWVVGIAPISFDHQSILGITIEKITHEKCGIIKKETPVISGPQGDVAHHVIQKACRDQGASLWTVKKGIQVKRSHHDMEGQRFTCRGPWKDPYEGIEIPLVGMHQVYNAAVVLGIIESLKGQGFVVTREQVQNGMKEVRWPGRIERVASGPTVVLDGAQNAASSQALVTALKEDFKYENLYVILGISNDKDFEGVGKNLCSIADEVIFTEADHKRSASANFLDAYLGRLCKKRRVSKSVSEALALVQQTAQPNDLILVSGSLHLVGQARAMLLEREELINEF
jgi:dihydrofolate synthase / folylpolyglutamate synthase